MSVEARDTGSVTVLLMMYSNVKTQSGVGVSSRVLLASINRLHPRDIGALLDHIDQNMKNELIGSRIAVMGGSCPYFLSFIPFDTVLILRTLDGGYMVYVKHFLLPLRIVV
jgi:hypothetical protein